MELIVRKAQEKDLDGLDQVMLVISDRAGDRETVKTLLRKIDGDPQKYLLVAEDKDTGTLCGSLLGVGRRMFQEIEAWGKQVWNCHYEILVSGMNRTGAHKFYQALGFEEVKGFKKYL